MGTTQSRGERERGKFNFLKTGQLAGNDRRFYWSAKSDFLRAQRSTRVALIISLLKNFVFTRSFVGGRSASFQPYSKRRSILKFGSARTLGPTIT